MSSSPFTAPIFSVVFLLLFTTNVADSLPNHFLHSHQNGTAEYIEVTRPLPTDRLKPCSSLLLLQHDFANTIGSPPVTANYSPPSGCPAPWTSVVLEFRASIAGEQYDRIAGVWLGGVEILRTSTAEPTESGIFWKVRKDVTKYVSLFLKSNLTLTVMLENVVNEEFTGIYHVNISAIFYRGDETGASANQNVLQLSTRKLRFGKTDSASEKNRDLERKLSINPGKLRILYEPADVIVPISSDGKNDGFWFRIQNEADVHVKEFAIPINTFRAVLEIYVSFHGNDEFWYSNPPDAYYEQNNLTSSGGNGAFRQVFATIDGNFVGSVSPFPVVFTGGINPLFWEPVVSIGAFDLPSYNLELTPFLGSLLDGKPHSLGLGVTDGIPFWLVDANLHLWIDHRSSSVTANLVQYKAPELSIQRNSQFHLLDGKFKVKAKRKIEFSGWVNSSTGNLTTHILQKFKFKNKIKVKNQGTLKKVTQKIKSKTEVRLEAYSVLLFAHAVYNDKYPLEITIETLPKENGTYLSKTELSNEMKRKYKLTLPTGVFSSNLSNNQDCDGWMLFQDHNVLSGGATNDQSYRYQDDYGCYSRTVLARDGELVKDDSNSVCAVYM